MIDNYRALTGCAVVCVVAALVACPARASNISLTDKYCWSETVGWINFRPTHGGVTVTEDGANSYLSGYAWGENVGWVKMGDGTGPYPVPGSQTSTDWGVNMDGDGDMSGYAWGENVGWIKFDPTHTQVTMNAGSGEFDDYAWGENVGYIHFKSGSALYVVIRILAQVVPALTQWGVATLVLALAGLACLRLRRVRAAA